MHCAFVPISFPLRLDVPAAPLLVGPVPAADVLRFYLAEARRALAGQLRLQPCLDSIFPEVQAL